MISYTYTKTIVADLLQTEINNAGLTDIQYIETVGADVFVYFQEDLSEEQKTLLDSIVDAHVPRTPIRDVTPRQIRQALVLSGVTLQQIELALDTLPEPSRTMAKIEWEYSIVYQRNRSYVDSVGQMLGWTSEMIDNLWRFAGSLD